MPAALLDGEASDDDGDKAEGDDMYAIAVARVSARAPSKRRRMGTSGGPSVDSIREPWSDLVGLAAARPMEKLAEPSSVLASCPGVLLGPAVPDIPEASESAAAELGQPAAAAEEGQPNAAIEETQPSGAGQDARLPWTLFEADVEGIKIRRDTPHGARGQRGSYERVYISRCPWHELACFAPKQRVRRSFGTRESTASGLGDAEPYAFLAHGRAKGST